MTRGHRVVLVALVTVLTGCTAQNPPTGSGEPDQAESSATAGTGAVPAAPEVTPAGPDVARAVEPLPTGTAAGSVVVSYAGLGELRSELQGTCQHAGSATTVTGSASTARVTFTFDEGGARLDLVDEGLTQSTVLAEGSYEVNGPRLVVDTDLIGAGAPAGTVHLDVACGA